MLYIFSESHRGYIKVGETTRSAAERIREQTHTVAVQFRVLGTWSALRDDGTVFRDHDVRAVLLKHGFAQLNEGEDRNEWYRCSLGDVKAAVLGIQAGIENVEERTQNFKLREEQERAIENTLAYYKSAKKDRKGKTPKFLWNAKMRFGKTFADAHRLRGVAVRRARRACGRSFDRRTVSEGEQEEAHCVLWVVPGFPRP